MSAVLGVALKRADGPSQGSHHKIKRPMNLVVQVQVAIAHISKSIVIVIRILAGSSTLSLLCS